MSNLVVLLDVLIVCGMVVSAILACFLPLTASHSPRVLAMTRLGKATSLFGISTS